MGFRDNHEAALARAAALQEELDEAEDARDASEEAREHLAMQLAETKRELERVRDEKRETETPPPQRLRVKRGTAGSTNNDSEHGRKPQRERRPREQVMTRDAWIGIASLIGAAILIIVITYFGFW